MSTMYCVLIFFSFGQNSSKNDQQHWQFNGHNFKFANFLSIFPTFLSEFVKMSKSKYLQKILRFRWLWVCFELLIFFFFCSFFNYFSIFSQIDQKSASFIEYYVKYCTKNEHNITQLGFQLSQVQPAQFSVCFKTKISIIKTIKKKQKKTIS